MKMNIAILLVVVLVLTACSQPTSEVIKETVIVRVTEPPAPTYTAVPPAPTYTPLPTYTAVPPASTYTPLPTYTAVPPASTYTPLPTYTLPPLPTSTPKPTATHTHPPTFTPQPTDTPLATSTPTRAPTPIPSLETIVLTGTGDSVVDVEKSEAAAVVHIVGNAEGRYFSVVNYGADGEHIDLLVNTTEPYDGFRPLDFLDDEHTVRFEVSAEGAWTIEVFPFSLALLDQHGLRVPGALEGSGDYVIFLIGGQPDLATIEGNDAGRYFGVIGYNGGSDLLVNETDPYVGTVSLHRDTVALEIVAVGPWKISVTER